MINIIKSIPISTNEVYIGCIGVGVGVLGGLMSPSQLGRNLFDSGSSFFRKNNNVPKTVAA